MDTLHCKTYTVIVCLIDITRWSFCYSAPYKYLLLFTEVGIGTERETVEKRGKARGQKRWKRSKMMGTERSPRISDQQTRIKSHTHAQPARSQHALRCTSGTFSTNEKEVFEG